MNAALRTPTLSICGGLILLSYCVIEFQKMPKEFLPQFKEETLIVAMTTAPGTSLETTHQLALIVDKQLYAIDGVKTVGHRAGRAERGDHVVPVSTVEFDIELEEQTSRSRNEIEEEIRSTMQDVPGVFSVISGPLTDRISHMLSGVPAKVAIKVSGSDLEKNREIGKGIQKICKDIPGLEEAKLAQQASISQLRIYFDRDKGLAYGITAKSFNKQLSSMLDGELLYELNEKERVIDLVSRLDDNIRQSPQAISQLYLKTSNDSLIQVYQVADIIQSKGPNVIKRENGERTFTVSVNPTVRDLPTLINELQHRIDEKFPKSTGYSISIEGEYLAQQAASRKILILSLIHI